ncbi:MAG: phosphoglucosamine mutase [Clostridia bacterium]|nr:phosphoglucosamine mutase [Clostridia bacterium]
MGKLFGTDGARGIANTELTAELALSIGRAAALVLAENAEHRPTVLIGKDTRTSSDMLEAALCAGLCSVGADVRLLGVIPTPAVAYLTRKYGADAGIMISASHNPSEYNGIKLFNGQGYKLPDAMEDRIEAIIQDKAAQIPQPVGGGVGRVLRCDEAVNDYVRHLVGSTHASLRGMKLVVDCANGSASATARQLFSALEADCTFIHCEPNGTNINENCGSTHLEQLSDYVKTHKCFAGITFDGDADRFLAVDENGSQIDGDKIIAALADDLNRKGLLPEHTAVVTVMSNLGFFRCCEQNGIRAVQTRVGDRYVLEEMLRGGYAVGGEQSGHVILTQWATTGDGQLTAVQLLSLCRERGQKMSRVVSLMERYPQVLTNVRADAAQKAAFQADAALHERIEQVNLSFGGEGRVLVRVSGTEPLIRVMVEGKDFDQINRAAVELSEEIKKAVAHAV